MNKDPDTNQSTIDQQGASGSVGPPAVPRRLGRDGPPVGPIGLGCMGMSWAYGPGPDRAASAALLAEAADAGVGLFDTADVYGLGANEELVGGALAGRGDDVLIATKVGLTAPDGAAGPLVPDGRPDHLRRAVDASLRRLGREVIDLYYLHRVDPRVPLAESWGALGELVTAGKVARLGLSEVTVEQLDLAQAIHPVAAVQSEFSLWTRGPAGAEGPDARAVAPDSSMIGLSPGRPGDVVGWTASNGAAFVPFAPLGRGFLTGAFDGSTRFDATDMRAGNPRFTAEAMAANQRIVESVRAVADRVGGTPAQVAIAWVLAQGEHVVPIPGTRRSRYLQENLGAAGLRLTPEQLDRLTALPVPAGERY